jgi:hypothetical protein
MMEKSRIAVLHEATCGLPYPLAFPHILAAAWRREFSAQHDAWTPSNPALGQCAITALLVQDKFGGEILRAVISEKLGSHYWNRIGGQEVDYTRSQFPAETVIPPGQPVDRVYILESERAVAAGTPERYQLLCDSFRRVEEMLAGYRARLNAQTPT